MGLEFSKDPSTKTGQLVPLYVRSFVSRKFRDGPMFLGRYIIEETQVAEAACAARGEKKENFCLTNSRYVVVIKQLLPAM